jgi:hypothetical protein
MLNLLSAMTLNPSAGSWQKMKVQGKNVEFWWMGAKKAMCKKLKTNRNSVIKAIKTRFQGKSNGG